jgi:putative PIN family toxin of toxin-antitoxin system
MSRAVLDTNVLVSAILKDGNERRVLRLGLAARFELVVSDAVLAEYEGVLKRPRFRLSAADALRVVREIRAVAIAVDPDTVATGSPDEDDNRFLECAEAAKAEYLVTGNTRHFPREWKETRVVTARQFLEVLTPKP